MWGRIEITTAGLTPVLGYGREIYIRYLLDRSKWRKDHPEDAERKNGGGSYAGKLPR